MVADREYKDLMDQDKKLNLKSRMDRKRDKESKTERQKAAKAREREIAETFQRMSRDLILVFKTNYYLRAIDTRLGNPTNTFTQINDATWKVFKKERTKGMKFSEYFWHAFSFYALKFGLFFYYIGLQMRRMFGFKVSQEELEDFELDYIEVDQI